MSHAGHPRTSRAGGRVFQEIPKGKRQRAPIDILLNAYFSEKNRACVIKAFHGPAWSKVSSGIGCRLTSDDDRAITSCVV